MNLVTTVEQACAYDMTIFRKEVVDAEGKKTWQFLGYLPVVITHKNMHYVRFEYKSPTFAPPKTICARLGHTDRFCK
jgi:hypothetical protein